MYGINNKLLLIFLLLSGHITPQTNSQILSIPREASPEIDGRLGKSEWNRALKITLDTEREMFLQHDSDYLYVGLKGSVELWGHLYIHCNNIILTFHPSITLGKVLYKKTSYNRWDTDRHFNFNVKKADEKSLSSAEKDKFLEKEGWIVVNNPEGKNELEFKIELRKLGRGNLHIALVYGKQGDQFLFWPDSLDDDAIKPELFTGYNPSDLRFNFKKWAKLSLQK